MEYKIHYIYESIWPAVTISAFKGFIYTDYIKRIIVISIQWLSNNTNDRENYLTDKNSELKIEAEKQFS